MPTNIDRIAKTTPLWVPPIVLLGVIVPPVLILASLVREDWRTAMLLAVAVSLSNWGSALARKYYDPHPKG